MNEQFGEHPSPTAYPHQRIQAPSPAADSPSRVPYPTHAEHLTQEPIDDVPTEYVTRERYVTLEQLSKPRHVHMGVAEGDPEYLPHPARDGKGQRPQATGQNERQKLHYDRYLELPKQGKSIFTRREQARARTRRIIAAVAILIVVAVVVWVLFLR